VKPLSATLAPELRSNGLREPRGGESNAGVLQVNVSFRQRTCMLVVGSVPCASSRLGRMSMAGRKRGEVSGGLSDARDRFAARRRSRTGRADWASTVEAVGCLRHQSSCRGKPVRLRIVKQEADLHSQQFSGKE
jgi:hypothetical protein